MKMYIQNDQNTYTHPLDGATHQLWNIMCMAARDIEAMCDEKAAEGAGEQR